MDTPENLATLGTQATGWSQTKHKTQDEAKQNTRHRMKPNKTQDTGWSQAKHKTQDEAKQDTGW
jgi:hypothetical protein